MTPGGQALRHATLGACAALALVGVREEGGNNRGREVEHLLASTSPATPAGSAWCAAAVQGVTDAAAGALGVPNPLDAVKLEAYVQSYVDWALATGRTVPASLARPGDLVCFSFGGSRYDHVGVVATALPAKGVREFATYEGNTGAESERDGDGFYRKARTALTGKRPPVFIAWAD